MSVSQTDISGSLKVSVELVAGMIEGEGSLDLKSEEESMSKAGFQIDIWYSIRLNEIRTKQMTFKIHGSLKKTIFATSFSKLKELIAAIEEHPEEYLSEVPQENYKISLFTLFNSSVTIVGSTDNFPFWAEIRTFFTAPRYHFQKLISYSNPRQSILV